MNKYVLSTAKNEFEGNPIVIQADVINKIEQLKVRHGKNIWLYGGGNLLTTFMNFNLVDEIRVAVYPVILGAGNPLFKNIDHRVHLKLVSIEAGNSGVTEFRYQRLLKSH
jgi:dihydrofolate reductase